MYTAEQLKPYITGIYQNVLGRAPDPFGLAGYTAAAQGGRSLADIEREIRNSPEAAAYNKKRKADADRDALINSFTNQISTLRNTFETKINDLTTAAAVAQQEAEQRYKTLEQQSLQAQTRQAAAPQTPQVASPAGSLKVIRPGGSTRFSRPELQIKGINI